MRRLLLTVFVASLWPISGMAAITPVPTGPPKPAGDADIRAMIAAAGDAKDYDKADLVYLLDEADVYVEPNGLATTVSCQVFKVLTDAGVKSQAVHRLEFDPATNRIRIDRVRVHRQDGSVEETDLGHLVTQPARQRAIYWGNQQQVIALPRLAVGDSVELRLSKIGYNIAYLRDAGAAAPALSGEGLIPPMEGHWYEVTLFPSSYPIEKKRYSVHFPKGMEVQYGVYNGSLKSSIWFDGERRVYTWEAESLPAIKREPHMVALDDVATKVVLATVPDWEMKSRWFYEVNEGQFEADDAIRAKVREITEGLTDENAKIAACNQWVADHIRYIGTSRGPCEGFTLHKSVETFHDRGGVCKDKAGMLVTMLRVLGHEAYAALTMAGSRVEAIPADQFNHTVTAVRNKDGSFDILDPTWSPMSRELWSSREALQGLVFGTPEGQPLTLSPYFEPAHNLWEAKATSEIDDDGALRTRIAMNMKGYPCTFLRRALGGQPEDNRRAVLEKALNIAPNARIEDAGAIDPYDYSRDGFLNLTVSAERFAAVGEKSLLLRMPLTTLPLAEQLLPELTYDLKKEKRQYGMRLRATRLLRFEETIKLPRGWRAVHVPESVAIDGQSAAISFSATAADGQVSYRLELALRDQIVAPEDYPDFRKVMNAARELSNERIVCALGDGQGGIAGRIDATNSSGGSR